MADTTADRLSEQMNRMAQKVEETRQRMFEESQRARAAMENAMMSTRSFMDRALAGAMGAAALTGGIAVTGAQQYARYGPWGGATVGDIAHGVSQTALAAIGASGVASIFRPPPPSTSYFAAPMGLGSALFHAGVGQAIAGMTGGLFGRSATIGPGYDPVLIRSRAGAELSLRFENIGNTALGYIPFAGDRMFAFRGMEEDMQRQIAQRLSFVRTGGRRGGEVGGFGFRASSAGIEDIAKGFGDTLRSMNRARGYDMSDEEAQQVTTGVLDQLSASEIERTVKRGGASGVRDKMKRAAETIARAKFSMNADLESINALTKALSEFMSSDGIDKFMATAMSRTPIGGMSAMQIAQQDLVHLREGVAIGLGSGAAVRYGRRRTNAAAALYNAAGDIDPTTMNMYGGRSDMAAGLAFSARQAASGLQFGNSSVGIQALYQMDPGALRRLGAGGGYMDFVRDQAFATLRNPFAALTAQYDPETQARMAAGGDFAAYRAARSEVAWRASMTGGLMDPAAQRAAAIQQYQRSTGISDNMEAMRRFELYGAREAFFTQEIGKKGGAQAAGLYESLLKVSPSIKRKDVLDLIRSGAIGAGDDPLSMSPARLLGLLSGRGDRTLGEATGVEVGRFVASARSNMSDLEQRARGKWAPAAGTMNRVSTGEAQAQIAKLIRAGYSAEDINRAFRRNGAGSDFRVKDGKLQLRTEGDITNWQFVDAMEESALLKQSDGRNLEGFGNALLGLASGAGQQQEWRDMRDSTVAAMGSAGEEFTRGVRGGDFDAQVARMVKMQASSLNNSVQRDFRERFAGGVTAKSLFGLGLGDAKDVLSTSYKQRGASADVLKRISAARGEQDLASLVDDALGVAGGEQRMLSLAAIVFAKRNEGILSSMAPKLGSEGSPMWIRNWDERSRHAGNGRSGN